MNVSRKYIDIEQLFLREALLEHTRVRNATRFYPNGVDALPDNVLDVIQGAECAFARLSAPAISVTIIGTYRVESPAIGGWLLLPTLAREPGYWIPRLPHGRRLDSDGHIVAESAVQVVGLVADGAKLCLSLQVAEGTLDMLAWRIHDHSILAELRTLAPFESQPWFQWGSHTTYARPADLYQYLIHGHIYENRTQWPFYWKICSENDAHALYVTLSGLYRCTGKRLYDLLRSQIVLSVVNRIGTDGALRHGEWSHDMECHYRLHASGIHLMLDYLAEHDDPAVADALNRAAHFLAARPDQTDLGQWFLHDELEQSEAAMRQSPFKWKASRVLGKSPTNMLVLNTHLDTLIALDRYGRETRDDSLQPALESAVLAARAILARRPAEPIYRIVSRLLYLTFLPADKAARLPIYQRALKRFAWKWMAPRLHHLKTAYPRLVFPGGFIDRAVSLKGVSDAYQPINLMDLLRFHRRFPSKDVALVIHEALRFTQSSGLLGRWAEQKSKSYALGFWAEALWHACMQFPNLEYRQWLAEAMLSLETKSMGLPPSLLGANAEAIPVPLQIPTPIAADERLRVANLAQGSRHEFLVVNSSAEEIVLRWASAPGIPLRWLASHGSPADLARIPAGGWIRGLSE